MRPILRAGDGGSAFIGGGGTTFMRAIKDDTEITSNEDVFGG